MKLGCRTTVMASIFVSSCVAFLCPRAALADRMACLEATGMYIDGFVLAQAGGSWQAMKQIQLDECEPYETRATVTLGSQAGFAEVRAGLGVGAFGGGLTAAEGLGGGLGHTQVELSLAFTVEADEGYTGPTTVEVSFPSRLRGSATLSGDGDFQGSIDLNYLLQVRRLGSIVVSPLNTVSQYSHGAPGDVDLLLPGTRDIRLGEELEVYLRLNARGLAHSGSGGGGTQPGSGSVQVDFLNSATFGVETPPGTSAHFVVEETLSLPPPTLGGPVLPEPATLSLLALGAGLLLCGRRRPVTCK